MTFDQFVLMYSVFSDRAPREMKIHYAFLIYGKYDNLSFVYWPHSKPALYLVVFLIKMINILMKIKIWMEMDSLEQQISNMH